MKWIKLGTVGRSAHGSLYSYGHTSTLCGHFIHVIGGKFTYLNLSFEAYDSILNINTMTWQSAATNRSTCFHTTCLVDDKLYRIGGSTTEILSTNTVWPAIVVEIVDVVAGTSTKPLAKSASGEDLPKNIRKHIACYFESKREIVVHGGRPNDDYQWDNELHAFEVDKLTWRKLRSHGKGPVNQSSHMSCMDPSANKMFVFASYTDDPNKSELYEFDYQQRIPRWSFIPTFGKVLRGQYGGRIDFVNCNTLILFGGTTDEGFCNTLHKFDLRTSVWTEGKNTARKEHGEFEVSGLFPATRSRHSSVVHNGTILYFGGEPTTRINISVVRKLII